MNRLEVYWTFFKSQKADSNLSVMIHCLINYVEDYLSQVLKSLKDCQVVVPNMFKTYL